MAGEDDLFIIVQPEHVVELARAIMRIFRRSPRLEISFTDESGCEHVLRAIAADGKSALGSGPTFVVMDERGHWPLDRGDALEKALLMNKPC